MIERITKKSKIIPKTNEEYISVTYGCIRFIDSNKFQLKSLDSFVKTLVDISQGTLENLTEGLIDNGERMNFVNEMGEKDRTIEGSEKGYLDKTYEIGRNFTFLFR